jgi:DNA-binding MarR family transcriptional regulator
MPEARRHGSKRGPASTLPGVVKTIELRLITRASRTSNRLVEAGSDETETCNVLSLARRISRIYDQSLAPIRLRTLHFGILAVLSKSGPLSSVELSRIVGISAASAIRNLGALQQQGLLSIVSSKRPKRRTFLITKSGVLTLKSSYPLWRDAQESAIRLLGPDGCRALGVVVNRLRGDGPVRRK